MIACSILNKPYSYSFIQFSILTKYLNFKNIFVLSKTHIIKYLPTNKHLYRFQSFKFIRFFLSLNYENGLLEWNNKLFKSKNQ